MTYKPGWYVLVVLSMLMGFASISTDLYLPALTGALQYGSGIFGSGLLGIFADGTPWPMGWIIAVCGLGCLPAIVKWLGERKLDL